MRNRARISAIAWSIRAHHPTIGVVVLSQHAEEAYAYQLLQHGTAGLAYLLKERLGDLDDLIRALREVVAGRSVIDPQVVDLLVSQRHVGHGRRSGS